MPVNWFNSFTVTGNNNRLLQTALIQMRRHHLDLHCLTFSLSLLHINFFSSDYLLQKKNRRQMSSKIWHRKSLNHPPPIILIIFTTGHSKMVVLVLFIFRLILWQHCDCSPCRALFAYYILLCVWQTVRTLIRCHILRHLIWVYTVCI